MKTSFKDFLIELSNRLLNNYKEKAAPDLMNQIMRRGDKRKAALRGRGVSRAIKRTDQKTNP